MNTVDGFGKECATFNLSNLSGEIWWDRFVGPQVSKFQCIGACPGSLRAAKHTLSASAKWDSHRCLDFIHRVQDQGAEVRTCVKFPQPGSSHPRKIRTFLPEPPCWCAIGYKPSPNGK
jgi:hypothetical protein